MLFRSTVFTGRPGATYEFRVRATGTSGLTGKWATARVAFRARRHAAVVRGGRGYGATA